MSFVPHPSGVLTGCQQCKDSFWTEGESLEEAFRRRGYYALFTTYGHRPYGDVLLCAECREKEGKPAYIGECQCSDCDEQRKWEEMLQEKGLLP